MKKRHLYMAMGHQVCDLFAMGRWVAKASKQCIVRLSDKLQRLLTLCH